MDYIHAKIRHGPAEVLDAEAEDVSGNVLEDDNMFRRIAI